MSVDISLDDEALRVIIEWEFSSGGNKLHRPVEATCARLDVSRGVRPRNLAIHRKP
jgi:hypothetical protein